MSRTRMRTPALLAFAAATALAALLGCSSPPQAKAEKVCTPGNYVFCRCQNRDEGTKLCNETGTGFGQCEPCEAFEDPEIRTEPDSSGELPPLDDGGADGSTGAKCGDRIVQDGEDCDDGNAIEDDGCNSTCKLAGHNPLSTQSCPGLEVHVWGGTHVPTITGSTPGSGNRSTSPNCTGQSGNATSGAAAADRVFKVVAHKTGALTVTTSDANYDSFLYVAETCSPTTVSYLACRNAVNGTAGEALGVPVVAGKTYYVFVDGAGISATNEGNFRVTFAIE